MLVDAQAERRDQVARGTERTRLARCLSVLAENPRQFLSLVSLGVDTLGGVGRHH
jgi:hypothetical protein